MVDSRQSTRQTFYLIDGSAYIYRAFFALPPLSNSKGQQTNAVYGFTTMLLKVLREHTPDCLAVVFDEKGPTQRHEEFKAYKAQRPEMPHGMQAQIPLIHRVVEAMAVPVIRQVGLEADDLIGTLARKAETAGMDVVIVNNSPSGEATPCRRRRKRRPSTKYCGSSWNPTKDLSAGSNVPAKACAARMMGSAYWSITKIQPRPARQRTTFTAMRHIRE